MRRNSPPMSMGLWRERLPPRSCMSKIPPREVEHLLMSWFASYMYQTYTWSPFEITESLFSALISYLNPYPTFLDIVQIFGEKAGPVEESFTLYFENFIPNSDDELRGDQSCSFGTSRSSQWLELVRLTLFS